MKLTASPFHPQSGELLPAYRDAYLRGDLSSDGTAQVDAYLKAHQRTADQTLHRFYELKSKGHAVKPVGWVQRQFELIRTEPERFRRRAAALLAGGVLVGGTVLASAHLPAYDAPTAADAVAAPAAPEAAAPTAARAMRWVQGQVLDENGRPLVGATVWQKGTANGVSTNATGHYMMRMPANETVTLQYAYAGYVEEDVRVQTAGSSTEDMTLVPREKSRAKKRWLFF